MLGHGTPVFASYIFEQPRSHHTSHASQLLATLKKFLSGISLKFGTHVQ